MLRSIKIENYRGFGHFEMNGFGRVNLLVGTNNSGKSSILEALQLLALNGNPNTIWQIVSRRGEHRIFDPALTAGQPIQQEADICHMFNGHEIKLGSYLEIAGSGDFDNPKISCKIVEVNQLDRTFMFPNMANEDPSIGLRLALSIKGGMQLPNIPLSPYGSIRVDAFQMANTMFHNTNKSVVNVQFVANDLMPQALISLWGIVALTPDEEMVYKALRFVEPKIEKIAAVNTGPIFYPISHIGFKVKLTDTDLPVPIGSLGDGIWKMLGLAIMLSQAKNGLILIDEIDTGFHYSVMSKMWRLVFETAKQLNIQVFATSHSEDCVKSLASICRENVADGSDVCLYRIDKDKAVHYNESQIVLAAEKDFEVR
jgi:hypothetical protein